MTTATQDVISHNEKNNAVLSKKTVVAFGSGAMGEAVYLALFNGFITIYYNQVLGLSNTLIGVAIMLALIGDAITDPVVGIVSDRWRSRHGRRHPFLFAAPIPIAISLFFIFSPPDSFVLNSEGSTQWALFAWLVLWTIMSRAFITLYIVPHLALGGELSKDQHQRSRLFSANSVFTYVSSAFFSFFVWSYFFAGEHVRESDGLSVPGHLDAASYGPLILFSACIVILSIWGCAAGTYKQVPTLSQVSGDLPRYSFRHVVEEVLSTFKNKNYTIVMFGFFFFMIASGIYDTLYVFMDTYFWELAPEEIRWLRLVSAPAAMIGALSAPRLMRRFDRKPVMLSALAGMVVFTQLTVDLRLLGWMPENHSPKLLPILMANAAGFTLTLGIGSVAIFSMIGDIIDENELNTGLRQEGLFYSARAFFAKASYSFGHLVAGIALDHFVRLPLQSAPGDLDVDVLVRLGIVAGPTMGIVALISLNIYSRYKLSRERHQEIISSLKNESMSTV